VGGILAAVATARTLAICLCVKFPGQLPTSTEAANDFHSPLICLIENACKSWENSSSKPNGRFLVTSEDCADVLKRAKKASEDQVLAFSEEFFVNDGLFLNDYVL
uniref:CBF domain-containing protein n=1 Tax=Globodera pallida TaxID=36090 RepID=A0A183CLN2_GLOPA